MKDLMDMKIKSVNACTATGYFLIVFENDFGLQCLLKMYEDHQTYWYEKEIDEHESGYDKGDCGEVNSWALFGAKKKEDVLDFILNLAVRVGVKLV